jgi:hypothetical protein
VITSARPSPTDDGRRWLIMKKLIYAAAAAALLAGAGPAHANGTGQDGPVGIGVIGTKLKVKEVRATLDGWHPGAKARVSLWRGGEWKEEVRGWKHTSSREISDFKHEYTSWNLRNRSFPHNSKLCVEFAHREEMACATIHR